MAGKLFAFVCRNGKNTVFIGAQQLDSGGSHQFYCLVLYLSHHCKFALSLYDGCQGLFVFLPITVSISQSQILLFSSTIISLSSILSAFLICPLLSLLPPRDRYLFPFVLKKLIALSTTLFVTPNVAVNGLVSDLCTQCQLETYRYLLWNVVPTKQALNHAAH